MNNNYSVLILTLLFGLFISCNQKKTKSDQTANYLHEYSTLPLKYARGFTVKYYNGYKLLSVRDWKDTTKIIVQYVLCPDSMAVWNQFPDAVHIKSPSNKIVCTSTTHIAELAKLNLVEMIAGVTGVPLIYDREIQQRIRQGGIANLGNEEMNYERLVELSPDFVFTSGRLDGGDKLDIKLRALHIPSVLNLDFMEQHPLARVEWLKFMAAFFDKEELADSIFLRTEERYNQLKEKAGLVSNRPTVFCNIPFKEIWYMPCGENYIARLIDDAGGDFLWEETTANNGLNLNLDYEAVYHKATDADIWLHTGFAASLEELKRANIKNAFFNAWKTGAVYNNNRRITPSGGFDFWESGMLQPDIILSDLIAIFHPELNTGHELYYYRQLK